MTKTTFTRIPLEIVYEFEKIIEVHDSCRLEEYNIACAFLLQCMFDSNKENNYKHTNFKIDTLPSEHSIFNFRLRIQWGNKNA